MLEAALERARAVSAVLRLSKIPHAICGGLAVHALAYEAKGFAHIRSNVDLLLERKDFLHAASLLNGFGLRCVELGPNARRDFEAVRVLFANEAFGSGKVMIPPLESGAIFPAVHGFDALTVRLLLTMKLSAGRAVDLLHVQDLFECHLITPEIERSLPVKLRSILTQVIEAAGQDMECGLVRRRKSA